MVLDAKVKLILAWGSVGAILLLFLPIDTLPLVGKFDVRIFPLSSALASVFALLALNRISISPLLKAVFVFLVFAVTHSALTLFYDIALGSEDLYRAYALARQMFALLSGIAVFFVLRRALINRASMLEKFVLAGGSIGLAVGVMNFIWGATNNETVGSIVTAIRVFIAPQGWNAAMRASGISFEPSHFAIFLVVIFLPVLIVNYMRRQNRLLTAVILLAFAISFTWTFSTAGLLALACFLMLGTIFGPNRGVFILLVALMAIGLLLILMLFPDNYMMHTFGLLGFEHKTGSFGDRFYSTVGPFIMAQENHRILLGYGLGGTAVHFTEIIPPEAQELILSVHAQGDTLTLATMIGRLMAETGVLGLLLFIAIYIAALWQIRRTMPKASTGPDKAMLLLARNSLLTFGFVSSFAMGSFAFPFLWFWLAVVDSMYIRFVAREERGLADVAEDTSSTGSDSDSEAANKLSRKRYVIKVFSYKILV